MTLVYIENETEREREREDGRFMGLITSGWVHVLFGLVGSQLYNIK